MLKLIDNVDINKLKEIGLYPKYDEDTGEITRFESYRGIGLFHTITLRTIFYKDNKNFILDETCKYDREYDYRVDVEIIYKLTNANLIEMMQKRG